MSPPQFLSAAVKARFPEPMDVHRRSAGSDKKGQRDEGQRDQRAVTSAFASPSADLLRLGDLRLSTSAVDADLGRQPPFLIHSSCASSSASTEAA